MKKKMSSKIFSALLVAAMIASMGVVTAFAETTITGTNMSFDKYLVMEGNANTPTATFAFTIAGGTAVNADLEADTPPIFSGGDTSKVTGTPSIAAGQAAFAPTDAASTSVLSDDVITLGSTQLTTGDLPDGKKYVSKPVTVNFSSVTFKEPGIYRYVITETAAADSLAGIITNDPVTSRILDVYVESNGTALSVTGYVMHISANDIKDNGGGEYGDDKKDTGFTNTYATYDLTLKKTVDGNQAYRQKYFVFTVTMKGAASAKYTVDLTHATTSKVTVGGTEYTNLAELTGDSTTGEVTASYVLKHNEYIVIQGLPKNTIYTVTEVLSDNEGYTVTAKKDSEPLTLTSKGTGTQTIADSDDEIVYLNYRNGIVPTGILLDVAPYALMVAMAGVAVLLLASKKRRASDI